MSFTAVVHITGFDENPHNAVKSVISSVNDFSKLLIIFPGYDESTPLYDDWENDKRYLEEHDTDIAIVPKLSVDYVKSPSIVEIPPYCTFKPGGLEIIRRQIKEADDNVTHFALSTVSSLPDLSPFYGFLVVMQVLDWLRSRVLERGKLYQYNDVRVRHVVQNGKRRYLPERQFVWRFYNTGCAWRLYGGETTVTTPPANRSGYDYVMWNLYNNMSMGFGLWIFLFVPIWILFVLAALGLSRFNFDSLWIIGVWIAETLLSYMMTQNYIKMRGSLVYCVLFPVYWVMFPFTLIFAKNLVPQRTWRN